jgi:hypothetical protein
MSGRGGSAVPTLTDELVLALRQDDAVLASRRTGGASAGGAPWTGRLADDALPLAFELHSIAGGSKVAVSEKAFKLSRYFRDSVPLRSPWMG